MSSWTRCLLIVLAILSVCSARPAVLPLKPADTPSPANTPNPPPTSEAPPATSAAPVTPTSSVIQPTVPVPTPDKPAPPPEVTPTSASPTPTTTVPIINTDAPKPHPSDKPVESSNGGQTNIHQATTQLPTTIITRVTLSGGGVETKTIKSEAAKPTSTGSLSTVGNSESQSTPRQNSSEGGSNRSLVAAGVSVGVVVVLASVGIFIFRKWKLSPSRHFRSKLEEGESYHQLPSRSGSRRDLTSHNQDTVFLKELHS